MRADLATRGALRRVLCRPLVLRSLAVAAVVGTALNLINQGDALLQGQPINWVKAVLTYCVPFLVASYGAYGALRPPDPEART